MENEENQPIYQESDRSPDKDLRWQRWLSLLAGGFAHAMLGSNFIFYTYINDIKDRFHYSQKEVELLAAMMNTGVGLGFLPCLLSKRLNTKLVLGIGLFCSVTGLTFLWSSSKFIPFYMDNSWLMAFYFLISGIGGSVPYVMSIRYNATHFDEKKRGRVMAVMFIFIDIGMMTFTLLYYKALPSGSRFENLMIVFVSFSTFVYIFCIVLLKTSSSAENKEKSIDNTEVNPESGFQYENIDTSSPVEVQSLRQVFLTGDYQLLAWLCSLLFASSFVLSNNMTVLTKENGLSSYDLAITCIYPPCAMIGAFVFSTLSDKSKYVMSRATFLMIGGSMMALSCLLNSISGHSAAIFISVILAGLGTGAVYTIGPATMSELFHIENLMRNWGLVMLLRAVLIITLHLIFGAVFDMESHSNLLFCKGVHCTRYGYLLTLGVLLVAISLALVLNYRRSNQAQRFILRIVGKQE